MPTVKELISEYGERLVGLWVRWDGDKKLKSGNFKISALPDDNNPHLMARLNGEWVYFFSNDDVFTLTSTPTTSVATGNHSELTKTPFELLDLGFCAAMCRNWEAGIKDSRIADDWQFLPDNDGTRDRYVAKILRHLQGYVEAGDDQAVKCEHAAAIACNANILWHIEGRGE